MAAYENVLHLGVQSLFTAPLTSMPRRGTIGLLPRFLRRKFRRWGPFFEPRCLFLARPRSLPADGSDAVPHEPSLIPFELPESYNVSADRLLKSCHGSKAFQGGLQLTYNGIRVRTIEAPFAAARSPQETEFIRQCLQNLAHCEVPILSSLGDLLRDTDRRLILRRLVPNSIDTNPNGSYPCGASAGGSGPTRRSGTQAASTGCRRNPYALPCSAVLAHANHTGNSHI